MRSRKPFKVHLFRVDVGNGSAPLDDLLRLADDDKLPARTRKLGLQPYRLEVLQQPGRGKPYWLMDFCKLRYDGGPGRASPRDPVTSFDLLGDEGFAEETAMLYDDRSGYAAIQYNHHGPRSGAIAEYLSVYRGDSPDSYTFQIQLSSDAQARLSRKKIFTKLAMKVAPARLSGAYRKANISVVSALESNQRQFGGDFVTVEVAIERRSRASLKLQQFLSAFRQLASERSDAVQTLEISGRDSLDEKVDVVDLLSEKLEASLRDLEMDSGQRYVRESRWHALERCYHGWMRSGLIPRR